MVKGEKKKEEMAAFSFLSALLGLFGITGLYLFQRAEAGVFGFLATSLRGTYPVIVFAGSVLSVAGLIWWGVSLWL